VANRRVGNTLGAQGSARIINRNATRGTTMNWQMYYVSDDGLQGVAVQGAGWRSTVGPITGVQIGFGASSTVAAGGAVTLWGSP